MPRKMPASDDPASEAQSYIRRLVTGRPYGQQKSDLDSQGGYVFRLRDGTYLPYRPPGVSSDRTESTTASVDINNPKIYEMNRGRILKLNFPKK